MATTMLTVGLFAPESHPERVKLPLLIGTDGFGGRE